ncbi:MAG: HD domain-containing protein [Lachnospiraceae bacterium]|nr:HD domain-containing protein [Lachnospiraceae bacterium]
MEIRLPEKVQYIITQLENAGYEGYAVGGCVRDSILQKEPDDWDITTSATPLQTKAVFERTVDTGMKHGTVTVLLGKEGFEVTTYRIDGEYEDSRHPKEVIFTANLIEDLKRRDFTINAMAYNPKSGIIDAFDGIKDLKDHVIRCVGEPQERFGEDALRIMRAVRFSAQLGFSIEEQTEQAAHILAPTLKNISAERICTELVKLLISDHPDYLRTAFKMGITAVILPEFDRIMETTQNNPHHCYNVGEHTLHALNHVKPDKVLRLAMLFHDFGKPQTKSTDEKGIDHFYGHAEVSAHLSSDIMHRLKFDNDTIKKVVKLVKYHDLKIEQEPAAVRRAIVTVGEDIFPYLLQIKQGDFLAQSTYKRKEKEEELQILTEIYEKILRNKDCISLKTLAVTGTDLVEWGMKPGKEIGETLGRLFDIVLQDPSKNTKEYLLSRIH